MKSTPVVFSEFPVYPYEACKYLIDTVNLLPVIPLMTCPTEQYVAYHQEYMRKNISLMKARYQELRTDCLKVVQKAKDVIVFDEKIDLRQSDDFESIMSSINTGKKKIDLANCLDELKEIKYEVEKDIEEMRAYHLWVEKNFYHIINQGDKYCSEGGHWFNDLPFPYLDQPKKYVIKNAVLAPEFDFKHIKLMYENIVRKVPDLNWGYCHQFLTSIIQNINALSLNEEEASLN